MEEPSVLDYLKSKLNPWQHEKLEIPAAVSSGVEDRTFESILPEAETFPDDSTTNGASFSRLWASLPWRGLAALFIALLAQYSLRPRPDRQALPGVLFLVLSFGFLAWAVWSGELAFPNTTAQEDNPDPPTLNPSSLLIGLLLALAAFLAFGTLQFTILNLCLLGLSVFFVARAFWVKQFVPQPSAAAYLMRLHRPPWQITIKDSAILSLVVLLLLVFFRFFRLDQVPPEMNSDHAEKFLDVLRVLSGQTMVFFSSNGGREALQFYLVAGLHRLVGLPLDFTILKLVTTTIGFLALPFIYLTGKELGNKRAGLLAALFAGIAYWPNVVSRVGLRLPFYMLFTAVLFYTLSRGLRRGSQNAFITAGIILGIGMYGYSADRILPLLVVVAISLYLIHKKSKDRNESKVRGLYALWSLVIAAVLSAVIFLPILRYILADPTGFFMRTFTRMGSWEKPISDPVIFVFLNNAARALSMFSWDAGVVWPISIPGYPALSIVSGGLFYIGLGLVFFRYLRRRDWHDLFLLISIPILMLPSMLAIAFPNENPNLYRTAGAVIPVFLLIGIALDSLMSEIEKHIPFPTGKNLAIGLALVLLGFNSLQDYNLVFNKYNENYRISAWNSSEMGAIARDFVEIHKSPDNVWVVGFPNWVDTRLVANNAGYPGKDYELKVENIPDTLRYPGPKLFLLNPQDVEGLAALQQVYPQARTEIYTSKTPTKDFLLYYVLSETASH